ncbi:RNA polymerase sigma factor [Anatilimnocola aggregata]|uniref:RNA polymerase sigma factor n=1 Tax=Anatilimnocola aggregata TaxID=2528021 RepID=A0A517Y7Q2_9BACT|nr:sigma-70 family RNA polymerase sigma factor [Anatilimnocola aggregata]QDU26172.1 RNA polymerase sigma factor [Anatilimnocola aggregata]
MNEGCTTIAVQRYLGELARLDGCEPADPVIRALLDSSVSRLHLLCKSLLLRSYPRLARPPLNLNSEEMLSTVVDRLMRAMREVRPTSVRQFFALANQHMRWELNDLARRLDSRTPAIEYQDAFVPAGDMSESQLTPNTLRMLEAIEALPEEEREVFSLVRVQGMTHEDVADLLEVSTKTVQRRLNRGLMILADSLNDLNPSPSPNDTP